MFYRGLQYAATPKTRIQRSRTSLRFPQCGFFADVVNREKGADEKLP